VAKVPRLAGDFQGKVVERAVLIRALDLIPNAKMPRQNAVHVCYRYRSTGVHTCIHTFTHIHTYVLCTHVHLDIHTFRHSYICTENT
jgi:hypothetical protein